MYVMLVKWGKNGKNGKRYGNNGVGGFGLKASSYFGLFDEFVWV